MSKVLLVRADVCLRFEGKYNTFWYSFSAPPSTNGDFSEHRGVSATSGPSTNGVFGEHRGVTATSGPSTNGDFGERRGVSATRRLWAEVR
ncbi:MAG: hypothetical protein KatS3mg105_0277 [Gemmatales bacterium]|nr:MAG: hypothetical protein KatS3mg105_0277 [Gemmatales bacterium]